MRRELGRTLALSLTGMLLAAGAASPALAGGGLPLPFRRASTKAAALKRPESPTAFAADEQAAPSAPPKLPTRTTAAAPEPIGPTVDFYPEDCCAGGQCPPYYRSRPTGSHAQREQTMINNRLFEPEWYRYYRCCHYGHYPTQWAPWPPGWLACRMPYPGYHPYDIKQPPVKPSRKPRDPADRGGANRDLDRAPADRRPIEPPATLRPPAP